MLRVGLAGIGFMGWIHYLSYKKTKGVKVAAICTRDERRLGGDWRGIQGNFGPPGEKVDLNGVTKYTDLDRLLADPSIDALQAGKHVFVEKPMGLTAAECDQIMRAADKAGKQVLVGHCLPFLPE